MVCSVSGFSQLSGQSSQFQPIQTGEKQSPGAQATATRSTANASRKSASTSGIARIHDSDFKSSRSGDSKPQVVGRVEGGRSGDRRVDDGRVDDGRVDDRRVDDGRVDDGRVGDRRVEDGRVERKQGQFHPEAVAPPIGSSSLFEGVQFGSRKIDLAPSDHSKPLQQPATMSESQQPTAKVADVESPTESESANSGRGKESIQNPTQTDSTDTAEETAQSVQDDSTNNGDSEEQSVWKFGNLTDRKSLPSTVRMLVSIASISLVPAILLMTTCFIRIVVVLGILRQAIGLQQLPPTQVTTALALMLTFLIMAPTWKKIKEEAIDPYSAEDSTMTWDEAWQAGVTPIKKFMWSQIREAENENDFWIFYDYLPDEEKSKEPESYADLPLKVILPAFMISELKVAFLIGIQILLPFLVLDIVVASFCNTMGLIMMPPTVVSLPLKLLLFVMVDGWNLIVGMLLNSFAVLS